MLWYTWRILISGGDGHVQLLRPHFRAHYESLNKQVHGRELDSEHSGALQAPGTRRLPAIPTDDSSVATAELRRKS